MARKDVFKKADQIRRRAAECGGQLRLITWGVADGMFIVTEHGISRMKDNFVVLIDDVRSVDSKVIGRWYDIAIGARTQPVFIYRNEDIDAIRAIRSHLPV